MNLSKTLRFWVGAFVLALSAGVFSPLAAQSIDEAVRDAVAGNARARVIMQFRSTAERDAAFDRLLDRGAAVRVVDTEAGPGLVVLGGAGTFSSEITHASSVSIDATVDVASVKPARSQTTWTSGGGQSFANFGHGVSVAVIDSGLKPHKDLAASRIRKYKDFVTGGTTPVDTCGHGTHVAGIIGGTGAASNGQYSGMAPGIDLVVLRVLGDNCSGNTSDVLDALEWVARNHAAYNIKVVNLSLGHPVFESMFTDPLVQAVERLSRKGIVVVTAAGNMGINPKTLKAGYGGAGVPCNAPSSVCVGALDTKGTADYGDDEVAAFSSRGPTRFNLLAKPDIVAAGVRITSLSAPGSMLFEENPALQVYGGGEGPGKPAGYLTLNGTSMASPFVAGTAALMLTANGQLSANTVKLALQYTARVLPDADALTQGAGALNAAGALKLAMLINPNTRHEQNWIRPGVIPGANIDANGQQVNWGKRIIYGDAYIKSAAAAVHLYRWDDNVVWGFDTFDDNVVWGDAGNVVWGNYDEGNAVWGNPGDDNVVWGDDNVVWGNLDDDNVVWGKNVVWGNNVVWGYWADNVVWGFWDDNVVWGDITRENFDNVVWGNAEGNVVWGNCSDADGGDNVNVVWGNSDGDNVVWGNCNVVWGNAVLTRWGGQ